jgi:hypothetical protein
MTKERTRRKDAGSRGEEDEKKLKKRTSERKSLVDRLPFTPPPRPSTRAMRHTRPQLVTPS